MALQVELHKLRPRAMPNREGRWFWKEWNREVVVYKKRGGRYLYVNPGGVEIRITPKIAGGWIAIPEVGEGGGAADS